MPYDLPPPVDPDQPDFIHQHWMRRALELAEAAGQAGEVPVGAVVLAPDGSLLAEGENRRERDQDPTAHAEIVALRQAGQRQQRWYLKDCHLYVTLEPCPMCAGAILQSRIARVFYGTGDPKAGALGGAINLPESPAAYHRFTWQGGILAASARQQLQAWFALRRQQRRGQS